MFRRSAVLTSLVLAAGLITLGCEDSSTGPGSGRGLTLLLTDAPGDFQAAVVTISKVYLQGQGGRTVLLDEPVTYDLLELRSNIATLVQGLEIPAGSYHELRLVIDGAYIEVEQAGGGTKIYATSADYEGLPDGVQADGLLHTTSWDASGLKIKLPGGKLDIGEGEVIVLIDFDVAESFGHQAGKSGKWVMHPVIRATDVTFGGHVLARLQLGSGVTLPQVGGQDITLAAFEAHLTPAGGGATRELELSDANSDNVFEAMFKGVAPGTYELTFVAPDGVLAAYDPALPRTVIVVAKETVTETVTVTSAVLASSIVATLRLNTGVTLPGSVTLGQFKARLTPSGGTATEISFTDPNTDNTFEATFANLAAGTYELVIVPPTGVTVVTDIAQTQSITLGTGVTETKAFVITSASAS